MDKHIKKYLKYRKKIMAFRYVDWLIDWDQKTQAPKNSSSFRAEQVEVLSKMYYDLRRDEDFLDTVDYLYRNINKIPDEDLKVDIIKVSRELRVIRKVPIDEYIDNQVVLSQSIKIWQEARDLNSFEHFAPILQKIIDYNKRLIKYYETDNLKGYDVLLDIYEEGTKTKTYDSFFEYLKRELVPFVMEVTKGKKQQFNRKLTTRVYPVSDQKEFSKYLLNIFNFDLNRGAIRDTIHPFTSGITSDDIRIASDYHEKNFTVSIFSVLHELGNAIYDQNIDPKYSGTFTFGGPTYGIHGSQARMYENIIGRSFAFWRKHYPKLEELFPKQLKGTNVLDFYKYINVVKRSTIRSEADELTYSLHIMVRYEIEKEIFDNKLKVRDIPKRWRYLMAKYVGVKPATDLEGSLQDIHWAIGNFGYFPSYASANAIAAQIYQAMNKDFNVESAIENNHLHLINDWLKEKVNIYGASKTAEEILFLATNEKFNPRYYITYLKNKFSQLK